MSRPVRIALTGGIATGKSHCLGRFAQMGVPVIDADHIAREVVGPGTPALSAIVARFGPGMLQPTGELDRARLARVVFSDEAARKDLEAIVHPAVYDRIDRWFASLEGPAGFGIADIPLLYETGRQGGFARVVVAACPPERQLERLQARGLSLVQAQQRLDSQLPIATKAALADYIIDTSGTLGDTDRQVVEVWERLTAPLRGLPQL